MCLSFFKNNPNSWHSYIHNIIYISQTDRTCLHIVRLQKQQQCQLKWAVNTHTCIKIIDHCQSVLLRCFHCLLHCCSTPRRNYLESPVEWWKTTVHQHKSSQRITKSTHYVNNTKLVLTGCNLNSLFTNLHIWKKNPVYYKKNLLYEEPILCKDKLNAIKKLILNVWQHCKMCMLILYTDK